MSYHIVIRNRAPRCQRQIEPVLACVEPRGIALPESLKAVTFAPVSFQAVSCTRPMVYGVGGVSPRIRMRRDDQLGGARDACRAVRADPVGGRCRLLAGGPPEPTPTTPTSAERERWGVGRSERPESFFTADTPPAWCGSRARRARLQRTFTPRSRAFAMKTFTSAAHDGQ
jgi:hypothetical protein